ncbi:long-chain-fatty-acid--CoA ligase [Nocardia sp. NPDC055029]
MTPSDQLARHARKIPGEVAIRFGDESVTYAEFDDRVNRLANYLLAEGVDAGDRVAVLTLNNPQTVITYVACARLGAISVPVNFRLTPAEVGYILADSGAVVTVVDALLAPVVAKAKDDVPSLRRCLVIGGSPDVIPGGESFDQVVSEASSAAVEREVDEHAPAFIMYTSGTTGRPKGAVLTHANTFHNVTSQIIHLGLPADCQVWMIGVPLFHIAGVGMFLTGLYRGGRMVIASMGGFDPAATVDLWEREQVNVTFLVPSQWQVVCQLPDIGKRDLSALRVTSWGAAPATPALLRKIMESFPDAMLYTAFGQTETSPVTTLLLGNDALGKVGSVGKPLLNVEVRIVDANMNDVAVGEVGEIVYRGPNVMKEYWNNPEATAAAFAGGWFHSGDLVRQDEDGFIYVVDRLKDMIISGGENVYCAEVENAVADHPKVADVAVIGAPDDKWGEVPFAVVVPLDTTAPPTTEEIEQWCRERLAVYKCPKRLLIVEDLPRNASGKILKHVLRADFAAK